MNNQFSMEKATMSSFLSKEVSSTAKQAAVKLQKDPSLESVTVEAANSTFTVSRKPLEKTIWEFKFQDEDFYLGLTKTV